MVRPTYLVGAVQNSEDTYLPEIPPSSQPEIKWQASLRTTIARISPHCRPAPERSRCHQDDSYELHSRPMNAQLRIFLAPVHRAKIELQEGGQRHCQLNPQSEFIPSRKSSDVSQQLARKSGSITYTADVREQDGVRTGSTWSRPRGSTPFPSPRPASLQSARSMQARAGSQSIGSTANHRLVLESPHTERERRWIERRATFLASCGHPDTKV
jgi:hypothetical protein